MKRKVFCGGVGLFVVTVVLWFLAGYAEPAPPATVIRALTYGPINEECIAPYRLFIDRVNEVGRGKVRIDLLGGSEVIPMREQPAALRKKTVDLLNGATAFWLGLVPTGFTDGLIWGTAAQRRETGWLKYLDGVFRKEVGITLLGYNILGSYGFMTLTNAPEMAKTLDWGPYKVLTSPTMIPAIRALNGVPLNIPLPEHYVAMQKGVAPSVNVPLYVIPDRSLWEVAKYYMLPCFPNQVTGHHFMRAEFWDGLPEDVKKILMDTVIEVEPFVEKRILELELKALRIMDQHGMKRLEMKKELVGEFNRKTLQGMWKEMIVKKVTPERKAELLKAMKPLLKVPLE